MNQLQDISAKLGSKFGSPDSISRIEAERRTWQEYNKQKLIDKLKRQDLWH